MSEKMVLSARWVFSAVQEPLERGTVTIDGERILAVNSRGSATPDIDLGNCALIPGLVNAHTHLDLSGLWGKVAPQPDFLGWLRGVIAHRRKQTPEQIQADVRAGLDESLRFGTTLVGDIAAEGASWQILANAPCRSVVFREMLGLPSHRALGVWKDAMTWVNDHPDTDRCWAGLSPHAPYSVHHSLFRAAVGNGFLTAIHLAETLDELTLIDKHAGPFVDFLRDLNVWDEDGLSPSVDWILWQAERAARVLLAHGNYLRPDTFIPPNVSIVYCPRTHSAFGHAPHPFREFVGRGVRVALGTDSLASNPDLDLLAEARFIHERFPDFPCAALLRMATLHGAEALCREQETGSLAPGKSADLAAVPLPNRENSDPYRLLFGHNGREARRTMFAGKWVELPAAADRTTG
jgi:cytosine/adenosine deaminase-related metal-dependent hydrolase